ncbi:transposase family protein [Faecalibaculum rodentium]|uniref:transposase family protein n=1 Tax=Faecalibaculum rodentium TaxID=1702221 RepID=UPI003F66808E
MAKTGHRTYGEDNPFGHERQRISILNKERAIIEDLRSPNETFASVGERHHVSATTVMKIFDMCVSYPVPVKLCRVMQIDETYSFKSDDSKYVCCSWTTHAQSGGVLLPVKRSIWQLISESSQKRERQSGVHLGRYVQALQGASCDFLSKAIFARGQVPCGPGISKSLNRVRIRVMKGNEKVSGILSASVASE